MSFGRALSSWQRIPKRSTLPAEGVSVMSQSMVTKDWRRVHQYIDRIRNSGKKQYAKQWLIYILDRATTPPSETACGIGVMAAQAVRLQLNKLITDNS